MDALNKLFEKHFGSPAERIQPLQGELGGSGRRIIRLSRGNQSAIGILYGVCEENAAFLAFSRHFRRHGLPVPEIYGEDLEHGAYIEEDLGDTTLFDFLSANRSGDAIAPQAIEFYRKVVAELPRFQIDAGRDLAYSVCYPRGSFDRQSITWDLNYFKYYFLRLAAIPFNEQALEDDFDRLTNLLLEAPGDYFLYRDFQSRNVMLHQGQPYFVDYQGGRKGALQYDIASLLFDAKADLPAELRQQLLDAYLDALSKHIKLDRDAFLKNIRWLLHNVKLPIELPTLMSAFQNMLASERLQRLTPSTQPQTQKLVVRIFSFSYHHDLPKDDTGNGGGFIFDARGLPNPGREERFKQLTRKDAPVIDYLNQQDGVHQYLANAVALVEASIASYQQRGFKNLMVSFGCTGGQHRSVFLAEHLAKRLRGQSGVEVVLKHIELEKMGR